MPIAIVQQEFGGPEVLEAAEVAPLTAQDLAAGEVLVRVRAAGVNPIDAMTRAGGGMAAAGLVTLPAVPGWDLAGVVEAVAEDVQDLAPVIGCSGSPASRTPAGPTPSSPRCPRRISSPSPRVSTTCTPPRCPWPP